MRARVSVFVILFVLSGMHAAFCQSTRIGGSYLRKAPNLLIGVNQAPILDPITGVPTLVPTGQTSNTMRFLGYISVPTRLGSLVPSNGVITKVRIRTGPNPAPVRVVIMQGSAGLYGTASRVSRIFRLRSNAINTLVVNLPVRRTYSVSPGVGLQQVTDAVALSAVGPGTLPFFDSGSAGTFRQGTGLTQLWYPQTKLHVPRNEGYTVADGLELLMQWEFKPSRRQIN